MWTIEPREILTLTGGGGEPFARFINALIRSYWFGLGLPDNQVSTTVRTNYPDGGVDAAVHAVAPNDISGRFAVPSAWQFKATRLSEISDNELTKELEKPYSKELIEKGYGYRLCVCDDVPDQTKAEREQFLDAALRKLFGDAPPAQILGASDLATWASRFPGIAGDIFHRPLGIGRHWAAWRASELQFTPEYVLPPGWDVHFSAIADHLDFSKPADEPLVAVKGAAGVGKTRLVFEVIHGKSGACDLVLVTEEDSSAIEVARWLVNQASGFAILVADECSIEGNEKLRRLLRGSQSRIRAVTIDNSGDPPHGGAPGIWLKEIDRASVEKILARNYPEVPSDRRSGYAELSGGYVRIAADLCRHDGKLYESGNLAPAIPVLDEYYHRRLTDDERRAVETVALLQRVGCDEDVKDELEMLAAYTATDPRYICETAQRLKNSPGFLVRTPRYLYVTPRIIAEIAFTHAWERWGRPNPATFLDGFPKQLLATFEGRVQQLMNEEVRSIVSAHFRDRVSHLKPIDLADSEKVGQLIGLLETDPKTYLPTLHRLVAEASDEDLHAQCGDFGSAGTRRTIVWAAERLAAFPEYFTSVEYILRRLALAESEPRIGNNATGIWRQLFRVWLSGTATPFLDRSRIYRQLLFSKNEAERDLALGALDHMWSNMVTRMGSPSVVGGRFPPHDWVPATREEFDACVTSEFELLDDMLRAGSKLGEAAWSYLISNLRTMIGRKELKSVQKLVDSFAIPTPLVPQLIEQLDEAFHYECGGTVEHKDGWSEYCSEVRAWRDEVAPKDFAGYLRSVVGKEVWHHSTREDIWKLESELDPIAAQFVSNPGLLEESFEYLCSPEARSAISLGSAIGRKDRGANLLPMTLSVARMRRSTALLRGYVAGLLEANPAQSEKIREIVQELETDDAELALDVIGAALNFTDPIVRIPRLVRTRRVPVYAMQFLQYGDTLEKASSEQFADVLSVFDRDDLDPQALQMASELIGTRMHRRSAKGDQTPENADTLHRIVAILRRSATVEGRVAFWWGESLQALTDLLPAEVADIAVLALTGKDYSKRDVAEAVLAKIATARPEIVLERIGPSILDQKSGWKWSTRSHKALFGAISPDALMVWLRGAGVEGARRIARHLPSPSLRPSGETIVPEVTARVLSEYGDDKQVGNEFFVGRHHLEVYTGSLAENYEAQAHMAEPFLNHPIPAIRRWAADEVASSRHWAKQYRRESEDRGW